MGWVYIDTICNDPNMHSKFVEVSVPLTWFFFKIFYKQALFHNKGFTFYACQIPIILSSILIAFKFHSKHIISWNLPLYLTRRYFKVKLIVLGAFSCVTSSAYLEVLGVRLVVDWKHFASPSFICITTWRSSPLQTHQ